MQIIRLVIALLAVTVCAADAVATGGDVALRMEVAPLVAREPALLTVRVVVPRAQLNRKLHVVAESPEFYTSSEVELPGPNAPALSVFEFRNLPAGLYEITGIVVDTRGERSTVSRLAKVEPGLGSSR
jgi:hypothetical protein